MAHFSKRTKTFSSLVQQGKAYSLEEALAHIAKFPAVKFDETVELHFNLSVNVKNSDQLVRGTAILPHGIGKKVRVAVFCKGEQVQKAQDAGAEYVGASELIEKVSGGFMDFDAVVATPDMMRDLSKLGKVLGPRGLMPSPKAGTVTADVERVIKEIKAGRVEFKTDKQAGIHVGIGKRSFSAQQLLDNAKYVVDAVNAAKPNAVKGNLIKSLFISTTMGPGVKVAA